MLRSNVCHARSQIKSLTFAGIVRGHGAVHSQMANIVGTWNVDQMIL